jgi:hypothetical protein
MWMFKDDKAADKITGFYYKVQLLTTRVCFYYSTFKSYLFAMHVACDTDACVADLLRWQWLAT